METMEDRILQLHCDLKESKAAPVANPVPSWDIENLHAADRWSDAVSLLLDIYDGMDKLRRGCQLDCIISAIPFSKGYGNMMLLPFNVLSTEPISDEPRDDPTKFGFSVTTSAKGGLDITIGFDTINVRKYMSAHHPLVQMLLCAEQLSSDTFQIAKCMVPQTIVDMLKESNSSTSPKMYEAGWSPAKCRSKSRNSAPPEDTTVGSDGRSSEVSLPVLKQHYDNFSDRHTIVSAVDMGSVIWDVGCGLTVLAPEESLHEQILLNNTCGSKVTTSTVCSGNKHVQQQIRDTEPQNHSNPDSGVTDHHVIEEELKQPQVTWLVASASPHHATGNRGLLSDFTPERGLFIEAGDGEPMQVCGRGSVITDAVVLPNVFFVPGLTNNLVSASQLTELEYCLGFARGSCFIRRMADNTIVGKASLREDGLFQLDYLKVPLVI